MKKISFKNKKFLLITIIVLLVVVGLVLFLVLGKKDKFRNVVVNNQSGEVALERNQSAIEIAKDMKLIPNDFVSVGDDSTLDLLVDMDKHIAVRSNTKFSVDAVGSPDKGLVTINVTEGKSYIKIDNPLEPDDGFQVVTPNAVISVRGTTFTVAYDSVRGVTRVECVEGKVNVISNSGEEIDLLAGDVVEVVDVMTTSTLTQPEINAIENVFLGGDGVVEMESVEDDADEVIEDDGEEAIDDTAEEVVEDTAEETIEDSEEENIYVSNTAEEIMQASVGDVVTYGIYGSNKNKTSIEWIVLENDGNSVTLLSRYVLATMPYHSEKTPITWENSDIRAWLNNDFYNVAFTETEKSHIQTTTCVNEENPFYNRYAHIEPGEEYNFPSGGNTTQDKVYLLSLAEIKKYFGVSETDYENYFFDMEHYENYASICDSKSNGVLSARNLATGRESTWWLRSPGSYSYKAAYVNQMVYMDGFTVTMPDGVRPVIKISL